MPLTQEEATINPKTVALALITINITVLSREDPSIEIPHQYNPWHNRIKIAD